MRARAGDLVVFCLLGEHRQELEQAWQLLLRLLCRRGEGLDQVIHHSAPRVHVQRQDANRQAQLRQHRRRTLRERESISARQIQMDKRARDALHLAEAKHVVEERAAERDVSLGWELIPVVLDLRAHRLSSKNGRRGC